MNKFGWHENVAQEYFKLGGYKNPRYRDFRPWQDPPERFMAWELERKMLGGDPLHPSQETGDCTSWGGKNATQTLTVVQSLIGGESLKFKYVYAPFIYGCSRVLVGKRNIPCRSAGSIGGWTVEAMQKYGILFEDDKGVPKYSGSIADEWGCDGPNQDFLKDASDNLVQEYALVTSTEEAAQLIGEGHTMIICSNQGFTMEAVNGLFHEPRGTWNHCMQLYSYEYHKDYGLYFLIRNSWDYVHGQLRDFLTGELMPGNLLRVRAKVIDGMLKQNDSYAISSFQGFPDNSNKIRKEFFKLGGIR